MKAYFHLDAALLRPIVDGEWHRTERDAVPQTGDLVLMMCGIRAVAVYEDAGERRALRIPTCCGDCDLTFRRRHGIERPAAPARP